MKKKIFFHNIFFTSFQAMNQCPLCFDTFPKSSLEVHASNCSGEKSKSPSQTKSTAMKRSISSSMESSNLFHKKSKNEDLKPTNSANTVTRPSKAPLAELMRPRVLSDLIGQDFSDMWSSLLQAPPNSLPSLIFWGPPGCGKTRYC